LIRPPSKTVTPQVTPLRQWSARWPPPEFVTLVCSWKISPICGEL
jgi:hypothetical protein